MNDSELKHFLEGLAEFHATNYFLATSHPGGMEGFFDDNECLKGVKPMDGSQVDAYLRAQCEGTLSTVIDICRNLNESEIADKIEKFKPYAFGKVKEAGKDVVGYFKTIIHGDYWVNNCMFKYEMFV